MGRTIITSSGIDISWLFEPFTAFEDLVATQAAEVVGSYLENGQEYAASSALFTILVLDRTFPGTPYPRFEVETLDFIVDHFYGRHFMTFFGLELDYANDD